MRCVLLLGLKRGLSGEFGGQKSLEHRRWERSEKDAKGFPGSDGQARDQLCLQFCCWRENEVPSHCID